MSIAVNTTEVNLKLSVFINLLLKFYTIHTYMAGVVHVSMCKLFSVKFKKQSHLTINSKQSSIKKPLAHSHAKGFSRLLSLLVILQIQELFDSIINSSFRVEF